MLGGQGSLPIVPASVGRASWLTKRNIGKLWVQLRESNSVTKVDEPQRMIPDLILGPPHT